MKKVTKKLAFVVCVLLFITPILSACVFGGPTEQHRILIRAETGGFVEARIGNRIVVSGSTYSRGSVVALIVTTDARYEVNSVRADTTELTYDTQTTEGNTTVTTFKHTLRGDVEFRIDFNRIEQPPPPPPPPVCDGTCGECDDCEDRAIALAKEKALFVSALEFVQEELFGNISNAIISQGITNINNVTVITGVRNAYRDTMRTLFSDMLVTDCTLLDVQQRRCLACTECAIVEMKWQLLDRLIAAMLNVADDTEALADILGTIAEISAVNIVTEMLDIESEFLPGFNGSAKLNELVQHTRAQFDNPEIRHFFVNFSEVWDTIEKEIVLLAIDLFPESVLFFHSGRTGAYFTRGLNLVYLQSAWRAYFENIIDDVIDEGYIRPGMEVLFRTTFFTA